MVYWRPESKWKEQVHDKSPKKKQVSGMFRLGCKSLWLTLVRRDQTGFSQSQLGAVSCALVFVAEAASNFPLPADPVILAVSCALGSVTEAASSFRSNTV
jgi:hypothetical protein